MNKEKYIYIGIAFKKDDETDMKTVEILKDTALHSDRSLTWTIKNILEEWKQKNTQI